MTDKLAPATPSILGDDPFADMGDLTWLGVESPPAPCAVVAPAPPKTTQTKAASVQSTPEIVEPQASDVIPALELPDDDAERALQKWLCEETPPEIPPADATPAPDAQAQLLAQLLAEQEDQRAK